MIPRATEELISKQCETNSVKSVLLLPRTSLQPEVVGEIGRLVDP